MSPASQEGKPDGSNEDVAKNVEKEPSRELDGGQGQRPGAAHETKGAVFRIWNLPDPLHAKIFTQLDERTRRHLPMVSKCFQRICQNHMDLMWPRITLRLSKVERYPDRLVLRWVTPEDLKGPIEWLRARLPGLRELRLRAATCEPHLFSEQWERQAKAAEPLLIALMPVLVEGNLRVLDFGQLLVPRQALPELGQLKGLEELSCRLWYSEPRHLLDRQLAKLTNLTRLSLEVWDDDEVMPQFQFPQFMASCTRVKSLHLGVDIDADDERLCELPVFRRLQELGLGPEPEWLSTILTQLTALSDLRALLVPADGTSARLPIDQLLSMASQPPPRWQPAQKVMARVLTDLHVTSFLRQQDLPLFEALRHCSSLTALTLSQAPAVVTLPPAVASLPLRKLSLAYCSPRLKTLPVDAAFWSSLTCLQLRPGYGGFVSSVAASGAKVQVLGLPHSNALSGTWTACLVDNLPSLRHLHLLDSPDPECNGGVASGSEDDNGEIPPLEWGYDKVRQLQQLERRLLQRNGPPVVLEILREFDAVG